jgi:hypothetical protein
MCKRYLALFTLAIALIANVTTFARNKNVEYNLKPSMAKLGDMQAVKAAAKSQNMKNHLIKFRGGGMVSIKNALKLKKEMAKLKNSFKAEAVKQSIAVNACKNGRLNNGADYAFAVKLKHAASA